MDGLELPVHERGAHKGRQVVVAMDVLLEVPQQTPQLLRRRWNEDGVARASAADPVLAAPQFPWLLARAAPALHEPAVRLVQQPRRERQALVAAHLLPRIRER